MKKITERKERLVRITSLGCAKNFVDTEIASAAFLCAGFGLTSVEEEASIQFVNTCAFLQAAREEAASVLNSLKQWKAENPAERKIIAAGCLVEWADKNIAAEFPFVDAWMRIDRIADAGKVAWNLFGGKEKIPAGTRKPSWICNCGTPRVQLTPPHYAYLKIADGCDNCCAYCLIPSIRGALRSRKVSDVVKEAENLIASGVRELIVIAQDSGAFGRDQGGKSLLPELLKKLDALKGDFYLRLMYLHPASVNEKLLAVMEKSRHLIRCVEMPIQHISENVLKAMNRKVFEARTREVIESFRTIGFSVRTTLLVGFPGETEADFRNLLDYVKKTKFVRLGVFTYSPEKGTPAAEMPDQVPQDVAEKRRAALLRAQKTISEKYNQSLIGQVIPVIVDEADGRKGRGRTLFDAPDIDGTVEFTSKRKIESGSVLNVKITAASAYELKGRIAE